jgi:hypothetical protein
MAFPNVSDIVATTIQSRTRKIADNVTKKNALYMKLDQRQPQDLQRRQQRHLSGLACPERQRWLVQRVRPAPVAASDVHRGGVHHRQLACPSP